MATSELTPVGADAPASTGAVPATVHSGTRQRVGVIGQYALLVLLSVIVLGPLVLTIRMALSPPFQWVTEGAPWHPVLISWKDRTWWSGGALSVVVRTLVVFGFFAWLQKVASGLGWKAFARRKPVALAVGAGVSTVLLGVMTSLAFRSFHEAADTHTAVAGIEVSHTFALVVLAMLVVAVPLFIGYWSEARTTVGAVVMAVSTSFLMVGCALLFVGPEVWTQSWAQYDLGGSMGRSLLMTVLITVLQVVTAIAAAYAFVFLEFPFKRILFAVCMATLLLPVEVTLIGNLVTIRQLGWMNTMQGLVLPFGASALGIFLINQGFRGIPPDLRDATRLDGYGHLSFMTKFAVPLTRPVVASFTVIAALQAWNQYLWPRSIIQDNSFNTLQIQLRAVAAGNPAAANTSVAAALVAAVPVIVVLVAFQRQIVRGLTAGAVK